jgi:hypothetical protein
VTGAGAVDDVVAAPGERTCAAAAFGAACGVADGRTAGVAVVAERCTVRPVSGFAPAGGADRGAPSSGRCRGAAPRGAAGAAADR